MSICTAAQAVEQMKYWDGYYEKASSTYASYRDKKYFEMDKGSKNFTFPGTFCGCNGSPWCAATVTTSICFACGENKSDAKKVMHGLYPYLACNQLWEAAPPEYRGKRGCKPKPGDVIVFSSDGVTREHTGMVIAVTATQIVTQEGNAGDRCRQLTYSRSDKKIYGYIRPLYSDAQPMEFDYYSKGDGGKVVKAFQQRLIDLGYSLGSADGDFGEKTDAAVKKFQKDHNLTVDGEVGPQTLAAIESASGNQSGASATSSASGSTTKTLRSITEKEIWDYLYSEIKNEMGAAAMMANMYSESGLVSTNLENTAETKLGYTDMQYCNAVDNGTYRNFVSDCAGWGFCQWTFDARKRALLEYATSKGTSIGDPYMQLEYLIKELKNDYPSVWSALVNATSILEASNIVLKQFERPAVQTTSVQNTRASYGQKYYDKYATGTNASSPASSGSIKENVINKLQKKMNYKTYPEIKLGSKGTHVSILQRRLAMLGYKVGTATGDFDLKTDTAVREFQRSRGLDVDGEVGPMTWEALFTKGGQTNANG